MNKKIGIVGYGYVGKSVAKFFSDHFDVVIYDPDYSESVSKEEINSCDMAVVSVPTPMSADKSCDLSIIDSTMNWLNTPVILIKSTIPPTTTKRLVEQTGKRIAFSPEYVGEGNYVVPVGKGYPDPQDIKKHEFQIIGGDKETVHDIIQFFKRVLGAEARYFQTDSTTAELCKYMENCFLATKVIFVNEFYDIAKAYGVNFDELREAWLLDGRIGRSHSTVFENQRGFSGKCLPKDLNALAYEVENKFGHRPRLLSSVLDINDEYNKT